MNTLSRIPTKIKVLTLVFYTIIIFVVSLLIVNSQSNKNWFSDYNDKPYDEFIMINVRLYETRKSAVQTGKEYESAIYNAYVTTTRRVEDTTISNIKTYIGIDTIENLQKCTESSSTSSISKTSSSSQVTKTISSIASKTKTINKEVITKVNEEPVKVYVRVTYTTGDEGELVKHELKYCTSVTKVNSLEKNEYIERKVNNGTVTNNMYLTNNDIIKDPFNLKITKVLTDEKTTKDKAYTDSFSFSLSMNTAYLGDRGLEYGTKSVYTQIPDLKLELFGKIKNDKTDEDNYFNDYILYEAWYGAINSVRTLSCDTVTIDEAYELESFYIIATVLYKDGQTSKNYYKVNVTDLL